MTDADDRWIEYRPLDEIRRAPRNPKGHDDDGIAKSVDRHGFVEVPTIDGRTDLLVAGHGRIDSLVARRDEGKPAPPGVKVDGDVWLVPVLCGWSSADDDAAEAYLLGSNQLTTAGAWDDHELARMFRDHVDDRPWFDGLGFRDDEVSSYLALIADDGAFAPMSDDDHKRLDRKVFVVCPSCDAKFDPAKAATVDG